MTSIPRAPAGLQASGRALWRAVQGEYELEQHETALLIELCRTVDALDALAAIVAREGYIVPTAEGTTKANPAAVEARQLRITHARLTAALRLPAGEDDEGDRRPQRRVGVRGIYGIRGGAA